MTERADARGWQIGIGASAAWLQLAGSGISRWSTDFALIRVPHILILLFLIFSAEVFAVTVLRRQRPKPRGGWGRPR